MNKIRLNIWIDGKQENLEITSQHITLGSGSYGKVTLYKDDKGRSYAVKIAENITSNEVNLMDEIYVNNTGFINLSDGYHEDPIEVLVMPVLGDSLDKFIQVNNHIDLLKRCQIAQELSFAFNDLYCRGYIHNDLKLSNIAISHDKNKDIYNLAIIDFQTVTNIKDNDKNISSVYNDELVAYKENYTPIYMSPERILDKAGFKSDTFSLTPVFAKIFGVSDPLQTRIKGGTLRKPIYSGKFSIEGIKKITPPFISLFLYDFLSKMQMEEHINRPSPSEVCAFFSTINSLVSSLQLFSKEKNINNIDELTIEDLINFDDKFIIFLAKLKLFSEGKWNAPSKNEEHILLCDLLEKKFSFENFDFNTILDNNSKETVVSFLKGKDVDIMKNELIRQQYLMTNICRYYDTDENSLKQEINEVKNIFDKLSNFDPKNMAINDLFKEKKSFIDNLKIKSPILYNKIKDKKNDIRNKRLEILLKNIQEQPWKVQFGGSVEYDSNKKYPEGVSKIMQIIKNGVNVKKDANDIFKDVVLQAKYQLKKGVFGSFFRAPGTKEFYKKIASFNDLDALDIDSLSLSTMNPLPSRLSK